MRKLQTDLKTLGLYPYLVDGDFGRKTREAVLDFQERYFADGLVDQSTLNAIKNAVSAWSAMDRVIILSVPSGLNEIEKVFGRIEYVDVGGGYVEITNGFDNENILLFDFPVVGKQYFHRKLVPVLEAVMRMVKDRGLEQEIKQFLTYCPRHKRHDPTKELSTHAYGIAVDINPATNQPGTRGDLHPGLVDVLEMHGFEWGGRWRSFLDPMHANYCSNY